MSYRWGGGYDFEFWKGGAQDGNAEEVVAVAVCDIEFCEGLGWDGLFDPGDEILGLGDGDGGVD